MIENFLGVLNVNWFIGNYKSVLTNDWIDFWAFIG